MGAFSLIVVINLLNRVLVDRSKAYNWFPPPRVQQVIFQQQNVLSGVKQIYEIDTIFKEISVGTTSISVGYKELCARAGPSCIDVSLLQFWQWNETLINSLNVSSVRAKINIPP